MSLANSFQLSRQSFLRFWAALGARERTMLIAAAAVITLGLSYALLIDPAIAGREQMRINLPLLRQQVAQLQALSKEAEALSKKSALPVTAISREYVTATLSRNKLQPQNIMLSGNQVELQLTSASFADILIWLAESQKNARLVLIDANIVALAQADKVNAKLTLRQTGNE